MASPVVACKMYLPLTLIVILFLGIKKGIHAAAIYGPFPGDDQTLGNKNHETLQIPIALRFAGQKFHSIQVTKDGLLGFSSDAQYRPINWTNGESFSDQADIPIIAPFYYHGPDHSIIADRAQYQGKVRYRSILLNNTRSSSLVPQSTYMSLPEFGTYIRENVVGSDMFEPVWGIIVTWESVTSYEDIHDLGCRQSSCKTGTFQAVILADSDQTYAIFNYGNIALTGRFYQAGFNHGKRRGWTPVLRDNTISNIANGQGSTTRGRYIFKISDDVILRGGCYSDTTNNYDFLEVYPKYGGMFGGDMIDVSGPCLSANDNIMCRFGNKETSGLLVNNVRARCPVPMLTERGRISLSIARNRKDFNYHGDFDVVLQDRLSPGIELGPSARLSWYSTTQGSFRLTWDYRELTNQSERVDINLYGYREDGTKGIWKLLETLASGVVARIGEIDIDTTRITCREDCNLFEIGIIQIKLSSVENARGKWAVYSHPVTLGWYVGSYQSSMHGDDWVRYRCRKWYDDDKRDKEWLNHLENCPCDLNQALVDLGRWQPDPSCNIFQGSKCYYHTGAIHCVRSVHPSADAAGNQCCYGSDRLLRYAADSFQGSTPDKSHSWGAVPYNSPGHVPSMSHWLKDVVTFYYCCLWTDLDQNCHYYMEERPTKDCKQYSPPKPGAVYGQGHIRTFDNSPAYRMIGTGDFILLKTNELTLQGRFEQNPFNSTLGPSVLTSIGISEQNGDTLEIRMRPPSFDRSKYLLDVLVNHRYHFFDRRPLFWQDFNGLSIVNTNFGENDRHSNFTVITEHGVGFQVADHNNVLHLQVMIPPQFKGVVSGLMGDWDDNPANDRQFQNGQVLTSDATNRMAEFQLSWAVAQRASLISDFHRANTSFPSGPSPTVPSRRSRVNMICGGNQECQYDYSVTGDATIARATRKASEWFEALQSFVVPVRSCGLLDVPYSNKNNYNYTLGNSVTIEGCEKGKLTGDTLTYVCNAEGPDDQEWSPAVSAACKTAAVDDASVGMIAGIAVGSLVGVVAIGIIVALIIRNKRKGTKNKNLRHSDTEKGQHSSEMEPMRSRPIVKSRGTPYRDEKPPHSTDKPESDNDE